jgi:hypothetical protein
MNEPLNYSRLNAQLTARQFDEIGSGQNKVSVKSALINIMRADVHGDNQIAFDEKHHAQVAFDVHDINSPIGSRGKPLNSVRSQSRIKWILFETFPCPAGRIFLGGT